MKITLNGRITEFPEGPSLKSVVERFCTRKTPVVAELNGEIIKTAQWDQTVLKAGDRIELLSFVGGGSGEHNRISYRVSNPCAARK